MIDTFSQVVTETPDNPLYEWDANINSVVSYTANGLNQYTAVNTTAYTYDANGNLTADGNNTYVYDPENRLISTVGQNDATLRYDPFGRLYEVTDDNTGDKRRLLYDGDALIAEYAPDGTMLDRYIHGASGLDDPMIWYEGNSVATTNEKYLHADRLGSIVALSKRDGTLSGTMAYDEYGIPGSNPIGRFRYTGQAWVPEAGLYYYKARMYSPSLGRFMQTDPIGYADGMNMYRYVGNDPVNGIDPWGLNECEADDEDCPGGDGEDDDDGPVIVVNGRVVTGSIGSHPAFWARSNGFGPDAVNGNILIKVQPADSETCGSTFTDALRIVGGGLQVVGDGAVLLGAGVSFINPAVGGALILGGKTASITGTAVNVGAEIIDGDTLGAATEVAAVGFGGAGKFISRKVRPPKPANFKESTGRYHGRTGIISNDEGRRRIGNRRVSENASGIGTSRFFGSGGGAC